MGRKIRLTNVDETPVMVDWDLVRHAGPATDGGVRGPTYLAVTNGEELIVKEEFEKVCMLGERSGAEPHIESIIDKLALAFLTEAKLGVGALTPLDIAETESRVAHNQGRARDAKEWAHVGEILLITKSKGRNDDSSEG